MYSPSDCIATCCRWYQANGDDVSVHLHDTLPAVLVPLHLLMRRADLRQREHLVHVRLQLTVPLGARKLADDVAREALDEVRLVRHAACAERRALDAKALEQERPEIDLLELAPAEEAEHDSTRSR
jgi:hypothetical protein